MRRYTRVTPVKNTGTDFQWSTTTLSWSYFKKNNADTVTHNVRNIIISVCGILYYINVVTLPTLRLCRAPFFLAAHIQYNACVRPNRSTLKYYTFPMYSTARL